MGELFYKTGGEVVPFNSGGESAPMPTVVGWDADAYSPSASSVSWGPVDYEDGDLLVMCVMHRDTLTTPSGWTLHDTAGVVYSSPSDQFTSILSRRMTGSGTATGTVVQASAQRFIVDVYVIRGAGTVIERPDLLEETDAKLNEYSFTIDGKGATQNLVIWALSCPFWAAVDAISGYPGYNPPYMQSTSWRCDQGAWSALRAYSSTANSNNMRLGVLFDYAAPGERTFTAASANDNDWVTLVALEIPGIPA